MKLTRWTPRRSLVPSLFEDDFFRTFEELADRFLAPWSLVTERRFLPTLNVEEHQDHYLVEAELPGVKKDQLTVSVADGLLTIRGERKARTDVQDDESRYRYLESAYGTFERSFRLPASVDPNKIEGKLEGGILRLTLSKAEEAKAREVKIQS